MEIALITDTHAGVRNDSVAFADKSKLFYDNVFFPYLQKHQIDFVVHLGDLVDRRKYVNFNTASRLRNDFLLPLENMHCCVDFIAGNHDTFYKSSNELNALQELIKDRYTDFHIFDKHAVEIRPRFGEEEPILLIPWICDANREQILDKISCTDAKVAFGHLELKGFEMNKGVVCNHGESMDLFSKFDIVCSGHYHHRSNNGNVHYLGSHAQFTWGDCDDARGFHVFDTVTKSLKFIENPYIMFHKLTYDDSDKFFLVPNDVSGCMVKVVVKEKNHPKYFEKYIGELERQGPNNLQIIEEQELLETEFEVVDRGQDTLTICLSYIDEIEDLKDRERDKLKLLMSDLYNSSKVI